MTTWTCGACGAYPDDPWGVCPACLEPRPVAGRWVAAETLIVLYPGNTQVDAAGRYRAQAMELAGLGFAPVATSWGDERPGVGPAVLAAHLEEAYRVGTLLVTYRREARS